jgi:hypothetical protein
VDGFLSKMPPRVWAFKAQARPATEFQCARSGAAPLASVITIRNPKHATRVWIAFSNAAWTQALFQKHEAAAFRQRHMRCITVSGGKVAPQAGAAALDEIEQHLAEYKMEQSSAEKAFSKWCPHQYNGRQHGADALLKAAERIRPQGGAALVALHDPVGLTMEIGALMEFRKVTFANHPGVAQPYFSASTISLLERTLKDQARTDAITEARSDDEVDAAIFSAVAGGRSPTSLGVSAAAPRAFDHAAIQKIANDKWRTYTHDRSGKPRFDATASQAWLSAFNSGLAKLDAEHILPLAKAHVAWLNHRCMVSHMSCTFDSDDPASNVAYTATLAEALRHTADKQPSYDQYLKWLEAGSISNDNLLMRALGFNSQQYLNKLKDADKPPLQAKAFPTDVLLDAAKDALEKLPASWNAAMAQLLQNTGGAFLTYMSVFLDGKVPGVAAAAVAAMSRTQFTLVSVTGSRGKFVQHLITTLAKLDPNLKVNANQLGQAVATQLKLLEIEGLPMKGTDKRNWAVVLDKQLLPNVDTKGLKGDALAELLATQSLHSPERLFALQGAAFKAGIKAPGFDALGIFCVGALQTVNFTKLVSDYTGAMSHEQAEARNRLVAGGTAIVGSFGEASGVALTKLGEVRLNNALGLRMSRLAVWLKLGGRLLGLGAGALVAGADLMKVDEEQAKGEVGLARAYLASALLGGGLAIAFFVSSWFGPVGWLIVGIAVIALLIVTFYIETHKDNKLQEWIMRCNFGTHPQKYKSRAEESEQLKLALV